jgi:hypothetical protein
MSNPSEAEANFLKLTAGLREHELVQGYRRFHLRCLIAEYGGQTELSKALGYVTSTFLTQMVGPTPIRGITEKTARQYEEKLGLPHLVLDQPVAFTERDLITESDVHAYDEQDDSSKRKYGKIDYTAYGKGANLLVRAPLTVIEGGNQLSNPLNPLITMETVENLLSILELNGGDLSASKVCKIMRLSLKEVAKNLHLDENYVNSLIELCR